MADVLGADREAFHRAWLEPSVSRSLGEFGPIEGERIASLAELPDRLAG